MHNLYPNFNLISVCTDGELVASIFIYFYNSTHITPTDFESIIMRYVFTYC